MPHKVFHIGERFGDEFLFVGQKEAFYFTVGLWSIDSRQAVLDAERIKYFSKFSFFLLCARMVSVVGASVIGHDCFWLAVLCNACFEYCERVVRVGVLE